MQRALVERAMSGDHEAFAQLATASFPRLYGAARLILRDSELAQDAVQDALVLAWPRVRALRDPGAWDAWLHRLAVRACYRLARKRRRRTLVELHVTPDAETVGAPDASWEIAERDRLGRELDRIDLDQRVVIVLHHYSTSPSSTWPSCSTSLPGRRSPGSGGLEAMRASMRARPEVATLTWGALVDVGLPDGPVTLVSLVDGTTSLYLGNGGATVGAGEAALVAEATGRLLRTVEAALPELRPIWEFPIPERGRVRIVALTYAGAVGADAAEAELAATHPLAAVYAASTEVLDQVLRLEAAIPPEQP
jgi:RNA polymerase sigma factor (sigma-70 family)